MTATIATVDEYKYLGMELGKRRGTYTTFFTRLMSTARRRASDLLHCGASMNELDARCSARLWSTLVRPILEYGAETWVPSSTQAGEAESIQAKYARQVLGCSRSTPRDFVCSELGFRALAARRHELLLRYWRRLCATKRDRLLFRVFDRRVRDVKNNADGCRRSLCFTMMVTLHLYEMDNAWEDTGVAVRSEPDGWTGVHREVCRLEQQQRTQSAPADHAATVRPGADAAAGPDGWLPPPHSQRGGRVDSLPPAR